MKKHQRNQVLVAIHNEARGFFRRLGIDDPAEFHALAAFVVGGLSVQLLVGDNPNGESADAAVTAEQRLSIFGFVFIEAAAVENARQNFLGVIRARRRRIVNTVDFLGGQRGLNRFLAVPRRLPPVSPFFDQAAEACDAGFVGGLAIIHRAADGSVHFGAAQFFGGHFLADGGLHQGGACQKKSAAVGHQNVIAHDGKIRAASHAHAHNRGYLRDAHGRHHCIVSKDAAEVVGVGENIFLQGQKNASRIHQIDRRDMVLDCHVLRADDFFGRHREKRSSFYCRVVGNDHHQPGVDAGQAGDDPGGGRASPLFIHAVSGIGAEFEKRSRVGKQLDALARGQAAFGVLVLDGFVAAAFANALFFVVDLGHQVGHEAHIGLKARRSRVDLAGEHAGGHRRVGLDGVSVRHRRSDDTR